MVEIDLIQLERCLALETLLIEFLPNVVRQFSTVVFLPILNYRAAPDCFVY